MNSGRTSLGSRFTVGQVLPTYTVQAHNGAEASENKIHSTDVARLYGFKGGLVPGVTDYAYMTRPVVEALGAAWLEHGSMSARFLKPLYEGEKTSIVATVTAASDEGVTFDVSAFNEAGELCATGSAALLADPPAGPNASVVPTGPLPASRPDASRETLAIGTVLGTLDTVFQQDTVHLPYLEEVADDLPIYRGSNAVAHSGYNIRFANSVLVSTVRLGPWIHVSSDVQHFRLVRDGDRLSVRSVVTDLFERKGHEFVDLDVLIVANESEPVMRIQHRSIYRVRKVSES